MQNQPARSQTALRRAFVLCVLCLAIFQFAENTADPDLWGHTLFGQHMLQTGKLTPTEIYSWTAPGHAWINHEIIAELALGLAHRLFGGAGLLLLKLLVGLLTFFIALSLGMKKETGTPGGQETRPEAPSIPTDMVAWAFGSLAVVEISFGFAARPQIFTALALAIEFWLLRQIHTGRGRWAFALPLLFLVWINTHGGALAGFVLLFAAAAATTAGQAFGKLAPGPVRSRFTTEVAPGILIRLWSLTLACATVLLANPYGLELVRWLVGSVLWMRPEIAEWNPVTPGGEHAAFFSCVAIAVAAFLFSRRPVALWEIAVMGALGVMAFRSVRHTPLFCLAALAFVPAHLADALGRFQGSCRGLAGFWRRAGVKAAVTAVLGLGSLGILLATFTLHKERAWTMEVPRAQYPVAALEFIKQYELRGNLLVFFDWGEQCLWELPESPVSLDGRLDTSYPHDVIAAHWKFYNGEPFDPAALDLERADFALLRADLAGSFALARQPGWRVVYVDDLAVVLVRDGEQFPQLARTHLPVTGPADSAKGRTPFPDRPSRRVSK